MYISVHINNAIVDLYLEHISIALSQMNKCWIILLYTEVPFIFFRLSILYNFLSDHNTHPNKFFSIVKILSWGIKNRLVGVEEQALVAALVYAVVEGQERTKGFNNKRDISIEFNGGINNKNCQFTMKTFEI